VKHAGTVDDGEVWFLQDQSPACVLPSQLGAGQQVLQGLVVGDQGHVAAKQERFVGAGGEDGCKHLPLISGIILFVLIEGTAGAGDHVFMAVVVKLRE